MLWLAIGIIAVEAWSSEYYSDLANGSFGAQLVPLGVFIVFAIIVGTSVSFGRRPRDASPNAPPVSAPARLNALDIAIVVATLLLAAWVVNVAVDVALEYKLSFLIFSASVIFVLWVTLALALRYVLSISRRSAYPRLDRKSVV